MTGKIEHIGIAVKDAEQSIKLYTALLGCGPYKTERVDSEGVETIFFQTGETKIELLAATHAESPVSRFIEKRGEGIHHIAFLVKGIEDEIKRLQEAGFEFISDIPKTGADNKRICFLHPKSAGGVLVELCEEM